MRDLRNHELDQVAGGEYIPVLVVVGHKTKQRDDDRASGEKFGKDDSSGGGGKGKPGISLNLDLDLTQILTDWLNKNKMTAAQINNEEASFVGKINYNNLAGPIRVYGDTYGWEDTATDRVYLDRDNDGKVDMEVMMNSNGLYTYDVTGDHVADGMVTK